MSDLTKRPDGSLEKTRSNLQTLIDRYIPRHTREEVWEMQRLHEERVWDLLSTIHEYRERNQRMAERMNAMEEEVYKTHRIPVAMGSFEAHAEVSPMDFTRTYSVVWRPDPYRMQIRLADEPLVNERDAPIIFETLLRQFEEAAKRELIPALTRQFAKLYTFHRQR